MKLKTTGAKNLENTIMFEKNREYTLPVIHQNLLEYTGVATQYKVMRIKQRNVPDPSRKIIV